MNRKSLLLLATLLTISLLSSPVAGAADTPCQGWGKATFVYEADVVEACLDTAIDVNAGINRTGKTPLIGATQLGDSDAVWLLLAAGANPNKQDRQEWTPLMFAAQAGHQEIVRQLATAGADPHIRNAAGKTALLLALEHEQTAMLGPLAAAGAVIDAATLVWVIEQGQHTLIPALAAAGVNLHIRLAGGATLLMRAAELGQQAVVEQLLAVGLDPNRAAANGDTALLRAAEAGHRDLAASLLPLSGDHGTEALFWAGAQGWSDAVDQLLALGVDPNAQGLWEEDKWGRCPQLYVAVAEGYTRFAQQLLAGGADPNGQCEDSGLLPGIVLIIAAREGKQASVAHLLSAGAAVNLQNEYGSTALMFAAGGGHLAIVDQLIAAGADVNLQNEAGGTALMRAAFVGSGYPAIVERLLAANADPRLRDKNGQTALDWAQRGNELARGAGNFGAIVQILRAATQKARKGWWR